uniref:Uncharacterized protein n=1 Tax=Arundo donax TaxID=35708 RepID=A0A0A9G6A4_ARUDO
MVGVMSILQSGYSYHRDAIQPWDPFQIIVCYEEASFNLMLYWNYYKYVPHLCHICQKLQVPWDPGEVLQPFAFKLSTRAWMMLWDPGGVQFSDGFAVSASGQADSQGGKNVTCVGHGAGLSKWAGPRQAIGKGTLQKKRRAAAAGGIDQ